MGKLSGLSCGRPPMFKRAAVPSMSKTKLVFMCVYIIKKHIDEKNLEKLNLL